MRFIYSIYLFIYLFIYLINVIISYILIVRIGMSLVVINFTSVVKQSQKNKMWLKKWATSWETQRNDVCALRRLRSAWASAQSDQSSLCTQWVTKEQRLLSRTAKTLIRLGGCPNWSESSLGAHVILFLSCCGSDTVGYFNQNDTSIHYSDTRF